MKKPFLAIITCRTKGVAGERAGRQLLKTDSCRAKTTEERGSMRKKQASAFYYPGPVFYFMKMFARDVLSTPPTPHPPPPPLEKNVNLPSRQKSNGSSLGKIVQDSWDNSYVWNYTQVENNYAKCSTFPSSDSVCTIGIFRPLLTFLFISNETQAYSTREANTYRKHRIRNHSMDFT